MQQCHSERCRSFALWHLMSKKYAAKRAKPAPSLFCPTFPLPPLKKTRLRYLIFIDGISANAI